MYAKCVIHVKRISRKGEETISNADLVSYLMTPFGLRPSFEQDGITKSPLTSTDGAKFTHGSAPYHKLQLEKASNTLKINTHLSADQSKYGFMMGIIPEHESSLIFLRHSNSSIGIYILGDTIASIKNSCSTILRFTKRQNRLNLLSRAQNAWFYLFRRSQATQYNHGGLLAETEAIQIHFELRSLSSNDHQYFDIRDDISDDLVFRGYPHANLWRLIQNNIRDIVLSVFLFTGGYLSLVVVNNQDFNNLAINLFSGAVTLVISVLIGIFVASLRGIYWEPADGN